MHGPSGGISLSLWRAPGEASAHSWHPTSSESWHSRIREGFCDMSESGVGADAAGFNGSSSYRSWAIGFVPKTEAEGTTASPPQSKEPRAQEVGREAILGRHKIWVPPTWLWSTLYFLLLKMVLKQYVHLLHIHIDTEIWGGNLWKIIILKC